MQILTRKHYPFGIALVLAATLTACGNASQKDAGETATARPATALPADPESRAAAYNFIDACVTSSTARLGEAKAFAYCKCMESQIRQTFGNTDSVTVADLQSDTATLGRFIRTCQ